MECLNNLEDVSVEETLKSGHICFARDVGDKRWYRGQIIDFPLCVEGSSKVSKLIQKISEMIRVKFKYLSFLFSSCCQVVNRDN
jgi:hypothetical protein